jgi:dTDP-4-dehydrorhamnose reductase
LFLCETMARVLVLGGTSYVAQFVLRSLQSERHLVANGGEAEEVEAVACTLRGKPFSPLPEGVEAEAGAAVRVYWRVEVQDVAALETCVQDFRPTVVINCAGSALVQGSGGGASTDACVLVMAQRSRRLQFVRRTRRRHKL